MGAACHYLVGMPDRPILAYGTLSRGVWEWSLKRHEVAGDVDTKVSNMVAASHYLVGMPDRPMGHSEQVFENGL